MSETRIPMNEKETREEMLASGTRWLLEMGLLNNEHMKNALILNIYKVSHHISNVELLIDMNNHRMLIYLELTGFGKLFKKRQISTDVLDMLTEALPSFTMRVIFDPVLFLRAVTGLKKSLAPAGNGKRPSQAPEAKSAEPTASPAPAAEAPSEPVNSDPKTDQQGE